MKDFPSETGKMKTWSKVEAMTHAEFLLKKLSKTRACYIATNANDSTKKDIIEALERVGLNKYFKDIFCFKEIGYSKPSKEFFDTIISKLNIRKEEVLMIGDDLVKDVQGAIDNGIDALLYDPENTHKNYPGEKVSDLKMILKLLNES